MAVGVIESLVIAAFKLEAPISVNISARNTCVRKKWRLCEAVFEPRTTTGSEGLARVENVTW